MKLKTVFAFFVAALLSVGAAYMASGWVESRTAQAVRSALIDGEHGWAEVETNGLQVKLLGTAPDEATRFRAVSQVGRVVDPDRIVDLLGVEARAAIKAPEFTVEMLRNDSGVSLIGLIPSDSDRAAFAQTIEDIMTEGEVVDMLETASFPEPEGWEEAVAFATQALRDLPKTKISVTANRVEITAISQSPEDKRRIETDLARSAPETVSLVLNITAPRPVISPFTLRFKLEGENAIFDACSADTAETSSRILQAAGTVGQLPERPTCAIGLGVPSPNWGAAVETAIRGLKDLGGGALTFSDADVTIVALDSTPQPVFDRVIGEIDAALPEVFSLNAILPEKVVVDGSGEGQTPEFIATHSPEGLVQLRGRLPDEGVEQIVSSYARAQFGSDDVYLATRKDSALPAEWPVRVLAALEALATLESGSAVVQEDYLEVRGVTGRKDASAELSRLLASKLDENANFEIAVRYDELLDTTLNIPTPQECVDRINAIQRSNKITFEPSSTEITAAAGRIIDSIAEIVKQCDRVQMEIGGHTDSQGRETMNEELSQARANSVLAALTARRVLTRNITAKGYGETNPIADNGTEEGREANRRIEFKLLTDARAAATDSAEGNGASASDQGTGDASE